MLTVKCSCPTVLLWQMEHNLPHALSPAEPGVSPAAKPTHSLLPHLRDTWGGFVSTAQQQHEYTQTLSRTAKSNQHSQPCSKCFQNIYNLSVLPRELQPNFGSFFSAYFRLLKHDSFLSLIFRLSYFHCPELVFLFIGTSCPPSAWSS